MAALNFVAAEDGLEEDPKLLGLARILKVPRGMAFWYVLRWQRLILRRGNHMLGSLPKNFRAEDVAGFLEFRGNPRRLIDAMKKQGYASFKKGRGFFYPAWKETTTGHYAHRREDDRIRHEVLRRERRSATDRRSDDVGGTSADASADHPMTSAEDQTGRKQGSNSAGPPDPPPSGGALLADARWEWVKEHAPTPQNREACKKLLGAMSEEDWALVQRGYRLRTEPGAFISKRNRRVLDWPTDQFLRKQAYLRFRDVKRPSRTAAKSRSGGSTRDPLDEIEARLSKGDDFLRQLLADPDVSEAKKEDRRNHWLADPQNAGRVPPWKLPTGSVSP